MKGASWVRAIVLKGQDIRPCACEFGKCHYCGTGEHGKCSAPRDDRGIAYPAMRTGSPETWITNRKSEVLDPRHGAVWLADRTCRWRCPCDCNTSAGAPPAEVPAEPESVRLAAVDKAQLDLFGAVS